MCRTWAPLCCPMLPSTWHVHSMFWSSATPEALSFSFLARNSKKLWWKCGEGRRIGVVIFCHQSSDTRHFSWAEFVGLSENYVLKGISLASSHDLLKRSREKPPKILGRHSGRDNLTTQNSKDGCFYIADSRRLTLSAYSLLGGPTPASLTGFKAWYGGLNSLGQYRSFRLSQMRSGSTDAKFLNVSKATW